MNKNALNVKEESYYENSRPEMRAFIPTKAEKILEVGCAKGNFGAVLKSDNNEIWAIEPEEEYANEANQKLDKVINASIDEALGQIPDDYFDVIIMNDVLEHLLNPWDDLKNLKSKLKDGGVIVSSIPNVRYLKNLFKLFVLKDWKYTEDGTLDETHFRFFTRKSIKPKLCNRKSIPC